MASLFWWGPVRAQDGGCIVTITGPVQGAKVGEAENVVGSACIVPGTRLWLFVHRKGLALWWPQGGGPAKIDDGKWQIVAYFGVSRDIGNEFEITARVLELAEDQNMEAWVSRVAATGQYPGIPMPPSVSGCLANTIVVLRDH
jgi:hypothetical protein